MADERAAAEATWDAAAAEVLAASGGPPTDEERAEARRALGLDDA